MSKTLDRTSIVDIDRIGMRTLDRTITTFLDTLSAGGPRPADQLTPWSLESGAVWSLESGAVWVLEA